MKSVSIEEMNQAVIEAYNRGYNDGYMIGVDDGVLFEKDMQKMREESGW